MIPVEAWFVRAGLPLDPIGFLFVGLWRQHRFYKLATCAETPGGKVVSTLSPWPRVSLNHRTSVRFLEHPYDPSLDARVTES
jgi:hypothetical protein